MDRRTFLELIGLGTTSSLVACNGAPVEKLYAYLTPPQDIVPGVPTYYATVCRACPAGCGVIVKTREARPIKLEGNPAHPVNQGALCARGQAAIQGLYSRHRVREPLVRRGGVLAPASWDQALGAVADRLKAARSVGLLTGLESGSFEDLLGDLRAQLPGLVHRAYEPLSLTGLARASELVFGRRDVPRISIEKADYVLAVGADLLDTWVSPVQFSREWGQRHGFGAAGRRLRLEYAGPRRNLTANAADQFHAIPADAAGPILGEVLAGVIRARAKSAPPEDLRSAAELLTKLWPAAAGDVTEGDALQRVLGRASRTGNPRVALSTGEIQRIVDRLTAATAPVVLYGGTEMATAEATATHAAALLINHLLGAVGTALRYDVGFALAKTDPAGQAFDLVRRAGAGELDALLIMGTNPAYSMPQSLDVGRQLEAAKLVVVLATELSETTERADVVLPVHHPLESWGDYELCHGIAGMMQPVRAPLYRSRHAGDVLLDLLRRAGKKPKHGEYKRYVASRWAARRVTALAEVLVQGGIFEQDNPSSSFVVKPTVERLAELKPLTGRALRGGGDGMALVTPATAALYDGRDALRDWARETPDSLTQGTWEVPLEIPAEAARRLRIRTGDRVRVKNGRQQLEAAAFVVESGLAPRTVALRFGGGRPLARDAGVVVSGNVMGLLGPVLDPLSGELAYAQTTVSVERVGEGTFASVSGGNPSDARLLCLAMEERDARAGRYPIITRHGEVRPWLRSSEEAHGEGHHARHGRRRGKRHARRRAHAPVPVPMPVSELAGGRPADNIVELQQFPEHRWGMVVDLDRCTGCGACVVACYAENNIPVVGRAEVLRGRELAWLRIERHISGEGDRRRVRFLPVMCQHCAQAPCETVCPVFAAYHTPDGLNAQIYNRCIGTRYCSNNCPYKVRRFNYFDYEREKPANQQLNPDVTVRSRGVMEKCTFCIHRIREVTNRAKAEGRPVRDGEIRPACVQTCPTGALTFGDFKQPAWAMTRLAQDPRGYRLLDYMVNTRPSVVYLRKVYSDLDRGEG